MIDTESVLRAHLATLAEVTAQFGPRIYAGRYLPSGYKPTQGPALLFMTRGGGQDYSSKLMEPSVQFRVYAATEANCRHAAQALYDGLNDQQARQISYSRMEDGTIPTLLAEPGSDWPYILMYFKMHMQNP
jgi:hypothetical protein